MHVCSSVHSAAERRLSWLCVQVSFAFNRIESALSYILNHLDEISGLAAEAERLDALLSGQCSPPGAHEWMLRGRFGCPWRCTDGH